jgi:putative peptide zinc metalloprotease protein
MVSDARSMTGPGLPATDENVPTVHMCRASFPPHYKVMSHVGSGDRDRNLRFLVADPRSDRQWVLGAAELRVAEVFCRGRSYDEVRDLLQLRHRMAVSVQTLRSFEERLIRARLLEDGVPSGIPDDPFTGVDLGRFNRLLFIPVVRFEPGRLMDKYLARAPQRCGAALAILILALTSSGMFVALTNWLQLQSDIKYCLVGTGWLITYAVTLSSGVVHEGAHAIACRHYGVRVREVGLAIYWLLPFGWTRPDQAAWSRLPLSQRIVSILAGPLGSLAFGATGVLLWSVAPTHSTLSELGVYITLAGCYGATATLLPVFNGDGYLIITELLCLPNLRRRSFSYLKQKLTKGGESRFQWDRKHELVYLFVALGTMFGWLGLAVGGIAFFVTIIDQMVSR